MRLFCLLPFTGLNVARQSPFAFEFSGLNSSMLWLNGICRCLDAIAGAWPNFKNEDSIAHCFNDAGHVSCKER